MRPAHFFGSIEINNFKLSRSNLVCIVIVCFDNMDQSPIDPLSVPIFDKKISDWTRLITPIPDLFRNSKTRPSKFFSFHRLNSMLFII